MTRQEVDLFHGVLSVLIREKRIAVDGKWVLPGNDETTKTVDVGDHHS